MDRLNSRREGTEETVSELEERTAEISQPVQHQENKWRALRDLRNYDKKIYIQVTTVLKEEDKEGAGKKVLKYNGGKCAKLGKRQTYRFKLS